MVIDHYGDSVRLNFPEYRAFAQTGGPRDIRFVTMAEEREHRQAEHQLRLRRRQEQLGDALLEALRQDPQVMEEQYLWFGGSGTGQQHDQEAGPSVTSQQYDQEAGPSGTSQQYYDEDSDGVDGELLTEWLLTT